MGNLSDTGGKRNPVSDKAGEIARNIWLAGIGAYGRAVEEAQSCAAGLQQPDIDTQVASLRERLELLERGIGEINRRLDALATQAQAGQVANTGTQTKQGEHDGSPDR